jgi:hypothetical protein
VVTLTSFIKYSTLSFREDHLLRCQVYISFMKLLIALGLLAAILHTVALLATDMTLLSVL